MAARSTRSRGSRTTEVSSSGLPCYTRSTTATAAPAPAPSASSEVVARSRLLLWRLRLRLLFGRQTAQGARCHGWLGGWSRLSRLRRCGLEGRGLSGSSRSRRSRWLGLRRIAKQDVDRAVRPDDDDFVVGDLVEPSSRDRVADSIAEHALRDGVLEVR